MSAKASRVSGRQPDLGDDARCGVGRVRKMISLFSVDRAPGPDPPLQSCDDATPRSDGADHSQRSRRCAGRAPSTSTTSAATGVVEVDQAEIPFREGDAFFEPGNAGKILVIGAVEVIDRGVNQARPRRKHAKYLDTRSGRIRLAMIANNSARSIEAFVKANVKRGTTLITDGHASYPGLTGYRHDPRIVGKMAGHIVLPWIHRAFSLMKRWSLGTYHGLRRKHVDTYLNEFVFRYNRRFHRHVSFEALLGLAAHYEPASYWDIVKRDNPRKRAETLRRAPRRSKTATGMRQDGAPPAQGVRRDQPIKPA